MEKYLYESCKEIGIELNEDEISKLLLYKELLVSWNEKMNLTAITEDADIILKHFVDSLTINRYIHDNDKVIDVGTGAGFPGLPNKIVNESISLYLLDSVRKKLDFLQDLTDKLQLKDVHLRHLRAEDAGNDRNLREKFQVVTARAVAPLPVLCEYCLPLTKINGVFIAQKGENVEDAKKAIKILGGKIEEIQKFELQGNKRSIIVIRKVKATDKTYPRKAGTPVKNPL